MAARPRPRPAPSTPGGRAAPGLRHVGPRRIRAYVGLGANVGDTATTLARAVGALAALPSTRLVGISRLYETEPVGVRDQPDFHNAVVALDLMVAAPPGPAAPPDPAAVAAAPPDPAAAAALDLLAALKRLEADFGRQARSRWGPRELDLDLLVVGRHAIRAQRPAALWASDPARRDAGWLIVPHPEARHRLFVLAPLADLAPRLRPPGWGETVASARARAEAVEGPHVIRPVGTWDPAAGRWIVAGS